MNKKMKPLSLEESLTEINQIVEQMEQNELTLEQSLASFERGVTLIKQCQKILTEAEQKVQILLKNNKGDDVLENYEIKSE